MSWGTGVWGTGAWGDAPGEAVESVEAPNSRGQLTQQEKYQQRQLGTDIFFNGDLPVSKSGDYIPIAGLENLRLAIIRRLLTRPGEYKFVPEYGVGVQTWVKKRRTPDIIKSLESRIRANLLREKRIDQVVDVAVENITDGIKINIAVRAAGRFLRFRPFEFAQDQV